jgi:hypothetical protein
LRPRADVHCHAHGHSHSDPDADRNCNADLYQDGDSHADLAPRSDSGAYSDRRASDANRRGSYQRFSNRDVRIGTFATTHGLTGDGSLSALDATRILQYSVGLLSRFAAAQTCGSDWLFIPNEPMIADAYAIEPSLRSGTCSRGAYVYSPLTGNATGQNFTGVLLGDCTGNWH